MYKVFFRIMLLSLIGLVVLNCVGKTAPRKVFDTNDIIGNVALLPANPAWGILDRDTTITLSKNPKLVVYFSNSTCLSCELNELKHWMPITKSFMWEIRC